jgi:hypothetical protein
VLAWGYQYLGKRFSYLLPKNSINSNLLLQLKGITPQYAQIGYRSQER